MHGRCDKGVFGMSKLPVWDKATFFPRIVAACRHSSAAHSTAGPWKRNMPSVPCMHPCPTSELQGLSVMCLVYDPGLVLPWSLACPGLLWSGLSWPSLILCGMEWPSSAWPGLVLPGPLWSGHSCSSLVWFGVVQLGLSRSGLVWSL